MKSDSASLEPGFHLETGFAGFESESWTVLLAKDADAGRDVKDYVHESEV